MQHTNTLSLFTAKRKVGIRWKNFLLLHSWQKSWVSDLEHSTLLRRKPRVFRPWMNAGRVPFEAPKERSRVCFGGFRPTKLVEEPRALARGAPQRHLKEKSVRSCSTKSPIIKKKALKSLL